MYCIVAILYYYLLFYYNFIKKDKQPAKGYDKLLIIKSL